MYTHCRRRRRRVRGGRGDCGGRGGRYGRSGHRGRVVAFLTYTVWHFYTTYQAHMYSPIFLVNCTDIHCADMNSTDMYSTDMYSIDMVEYRYVLVLSTGMHNTDTFSTPHTCTRMRSRVINTNS